MKIGEDPTQEEVRKYLGYDAATGILTWKKRTVDMFKPTVYQKRVCDMWNLKYSGNQAGYDNGTGYLVLRINGRTCLASRISFIHQNGVIGKSEVDHINRDKFDNRIENLRLSNRSLNTRNCSIAKNNKSGVTGVCFNKSHNLWVACITNKGQKIEIGSSKSFNKAVNLRYGAEVKYGYINVNPESSAYKYLQEAQNA